MLAPCVVEGGGGCALGVLGGGEEPCRALDVLKCCGCGVPLGGEVGDALGKRTGGLELSEALVELGDLCGEIAGSSLGGRPTLALFGQISSAVVARRSDPARLGPCGP
ncbi:MAG: hypothetical protein WKH64_15820 [Chloroflexia bacterium]